MRAAPSLQFRNPFEIKREQLVVQLGKMSTNLLLNLDEKRVPVLEGGLPGTVINLQNAGLSFHNLLWFEYETFCKRFASSTRFTVSL